MGDLERAEDLSALERCITHFDPKDIQRGYLEARDRFPFISKYPVGIERVFDSCFAMVDGWIMIWRLQVSRLYLSRVVLLSSVLLAGCCSRVTPVVRIPFNKMGDKGLWQPNDKSAVFIVKEGKDSHFSGPHLRIDPSRAPGTAHLGAMFLTEQTDFLAPLVDPAGVGEAFHRMDGAITFLARPVILDPKGSRAFAPIDWKFQGQSATNTSFRLVFQTEQRKPSDGDLIRMSLTLKTGSYKCIEICGRDDLTTGVGMNGPISGFVDPDTLYQVALTFSTGEHGWIKMKGFIRPKGKKIHTARDPDLEAKFRVHASEVPWDHRFIPPGNYRYVLFGLHNQNQDFIEQVDLDEFRIYDRVPRIVCAD